MAFTKVRGRGVTTTDNYTVGVITATKFVGPITGGGGGIQVGLLTATALDINGDADISGNLTVGGDFTTLNTTLREVELLHVDANSSATAGIITQRGSGDILNLFDNNAEVLTVIDGGRVGIGKTNPDTNSILHIKKASVNQVKIETTNSNSYGVLRFAESDHDGTKDKYLIAYGDDTGATANGFALKNQIGHIGFFAGGVAAGDEALRITSAGNVGIGSETPGRPLTITHADPRIRLQDSDSGGHAEIYTDNNNDLHLTADSSSSAGSSKIIFHVDGTNEKMRITNTGQVAIGTVTAETGYRLTVQGDLSLGEKSGVSNTYIDQKQDGDLHLINSGRTAQGATGSPGTAGVGINRFNDISGGTSLFRDFAVYNGKNSKVLVVDGSASSVGIGTDGPTFPSGKGLEIHDTSTPRLKLSNSTTGVASGDGLQIYMSGSSAIFDQKENAEMRFYTNGIEKIRILANGRLGIGTNAPLGIAHVNVGGGSTEPFVIERSVSGESIWSMKPYAGNLYFRGGPAVSNYSTDRFAILYGGDNAYGGDVAFFGTAAGIASCYWDASANKLIFKDNSKLVLGDGEDFTMYHDGLGNSILQDDNNLYIKANSIYIEANQSEASAIFNYNGSVKLYYDGGTYSTPKFETTATGITVDGEVAASQDYPNYRPKVDWNFAAVKKLDSRLTYKRTGPASYTDEKGIVRVVGDNVPRFDYDSETGESKGLLIEPSRTSKLTQSTHNDSYSHYKQTDRGETIKGPDGVENSAREYTANSDAGTGGSTTVWASEALGMASGLSVSYFVKITRGSTIAFQIMDNNNARESEKVAISGGYITDGSYATVSQSDPGSTEGTTSYELYPNGWVRVKWYGASGSANSTSYIQLYIYDHANSNGTNIGYAIWGFQVESGAFCTSPIYKPTTATVTRGTDFTYLDGADGTEFDDLYKKDEGTFILDWFNDPQGNHNDGYVFTVDDGTGSNRIGAVNSNNYQVTVTSGGSSQGNRDLGSINSGANKMAFTYKLNDQATSLNGSDASVDTSSSLPTGLKYWWFGLRQGQYDMLGGYIRRFIYYPKRLPNNQLKTLSS